MLTNTNGVLNLALVAGTLTCSASADVFDVFDDRAAWIASASGPIITEGFEGQDALGPLDAPSNFETGLGVAVTGQAADTSVVEAGDPLNYGLQNTTVGGSQYIRFGFGSGVFGDYTIQFLLPEAANAFGFDIADWEPGLIVLGPQGADVSLLNNGQTVWTFFLTGDETESGVLAFVGFTAGFSFDEVRFTVNERGDNFAGGAQFLDVTGVDEVAWAVPAPGAGGLLALAGVCAARRRR